MKSGKAMAAVWLLAALGGMISSCKKYLDVVPDNVATIDNAFALRNEAEKFLFTCYSYLPKDGDSWYNPALTSVDEIWYPQNNYTDWQGAFYIAQGLQNVSTPYFNMWEGNYIGGTNSLSSPRPTLWTGIRNCNILLENLADVNKVPDLSPTDRSRWIGEGLFLKAYYHYFLLRMYGPIPLIYNNVAVDADLSGSYVKRLPVDSCVNTISRWLDSSIKLLPVRIQNENQELGRITQPIALAVKAKLLMTAASPLFNGNSDYAGFTDKDGTALFNATYDAGKWTKARDAVQAAITSAEANGASLYYYRNDTYGLSDATKTQLNVRAALTELWNPEVVWGNSNSFFINQFLCMPPVSGQNLKYQQPRGNLQGVWSPPIKIAKLFYSSNGVPINEDKTLNFANYAQLRTAVDSEKYYIQTGYTTARLNFDREPRFYADLGFDGGVWYMQDGNGAHSDIDNLYVKAKNGEPAGYGDFQKWSETGYFVKKLINWRTGTNQTSYPTFVNYPWPEIRLSDLYLLYAEAENEVTPASSVAITYLDKIRARAGLKGVAESWSAYSTNPSKYTTQAGLRDIIHRERAIELMFEGQRCWDLRRWKEANADLNQDITGWSITGTTSDTYYKERYVTTQRFIAPRDYFWPIGVNQTRRNPLLVENLGW